MIIVISHLWNFVFVTSFFTLFRVMMNLHEYVPLLGKVHRFIVTMTDVQTDTLYHIVMCKPIFNLKMYIGSKCYLFYVESNNLFFRNTSDTKYQK